MNPVDQDKFYVVGVSRGNCQQAAVASLLGLPLNDVPNFIEAAQGFWPSYHAFLKSKGLVDIELPKNHVPDCYYLAYGPSARGVSHACVYFEGRLAHDPHPSRGGLLGVREVHLVVPVEIRLLYAAEVSSQ
jgi:hypothetical protein